jgi:hypothetical protein
LRERPATAEVTGLTQAKTASPPGSALAVAAVRSLDPRQVKLVEAAAAIPLQAA